MYPIKDEVLAWLLEPESPGARYLTLRDLLHRAEDDAELIAARRAAHQSGPIADILNAMDPAGYWVKPGPGYGPKYTSTVWALILLAQLGASIHEDDRIQSACAYFLNHAVTRHGHISSSSAPSGTIDCLQGNLCWALNELGCRDPRLEQAFEWMARSVTGEGVAPSSERDAELRYYAYQCGPNFACGANDKQPCAWGAAKVMMAFSRWPIDRRTPLIERAVQQGIDFLLSTDPAQAGYPCGYSSAPNRAWWNFGFPVFYVTDVLQIVDALAHLGCGADPRLSNALALIRDKQDSAGRWLMEYPYTGKTWGDFGAKKQPNKWVTLRALRALRAA